MGLISDTFEEAGQEVELSQLSVRDLVRLSVGGSLEATIELARRQGTETKSTIRRVRTAEGAAHYGQPIGSIIRLDAPELAVRPDYGYLDHQVVMRLMDAGVKPDYDTEMVTMFLYQGRGQKLDRDLEAGQRLYPMPVPALEAVVDEPGGGPLERLTLRVPIPWLAIPRQGHGDQFHAFQLREGVVSRVDTMVDKRQSRIMDEGELKERSLRKAGAEVHDDGTVTVYFRTDVKPRRIKNSGLSVSRDEYPVFYTQRQPYSVQVRLPITALRLPRAQPAPGDVMEMGLDASWPAYHIDISQYMTEHVSDEPAVIPQHTWAEMARYASMERYPRGTEVEVIGAGSVGDTRLVTLPNGRKLIDKTHYGASAPTVDFRERAASLIGEAIGAPVPKVVIVPEKTVSGPHPDDLASWEPGDSPLDPEHDVPQHVLMDHIDAIMGHQAFGHGLEVRDISEEAYRSDRGILIGLLDALIGNEDRHSENWLVDENGDLWAIDHGETMRMSGPDDPDDPDRWEEKPAIADYRGFLEHFVEQPRGSNRRWKSSNALSQADVVLITARLEALEREFDLDPIGQMRSSFDEDAIIPGSGLDPRGLYRVIMKRWAAIAARARGERNLVA